MTIDDTLHETIPTEDIVRKLSCYRNFDLDANDFVCNVANYFGERLRSRKICPLAFMAEYLLMIDDLINGREDITDKSTPSKISGQKEWIYDDLMIYLPIFAQKVCPSEFAQKVKEIADKIEADTQESETHL